MQTKGVLNNEYTHLTFDETVKELHFWKWCFSFTSLKALKTGNTKASLPILSQSLSMGIYIYPITQALLVSTTIHFSLFTFLAKKWQEFNSKVLNT